MKLLSALIVAMACCGVAVAETLPMPRLRPAQGATAEPTQAAKPEELASACRLRLTAEWAIAPSLPALVGPGECGVDDVVQLEAVVLADNTRITLTPPAILRCTFAEAVVHWVREDVAPAALALDAALKGIDNYASYDCRGRNRVAGAKLSEHGKANALDVRSLKLTNGKVVGLTDVLVARDFREGLRKATCARFTTVLGPGSDGYHENHVHLDLAERRSGYRMCQWDVREPGEEGAANGAAVPLPRRRPAVGG